MDREYLEGLKPRTIIEGCGHGFYNETKHYDAADVEKMREALLRVMDVCDGADGRGIVVGGFIDETTLFVGKVRKAIGGEDE